MIVSRRSVLFLFIAVLLSLPGCNGDQADPEKGSLVGPSGVRMGMTRPEVVQTMLDEVQLLQMSGQVTNPYAARFVRNINGESMEVMYYYTGIKMGDDLVTEDELVPIMTGLVQRTAWMSQSRAAAEAAVALDKQVI